MRTTSGVMVLALAAGAAGPSMAQTAERRFNCQVGGVEAQFRVAGDTIDATFASGEKYVLKLDPNRYRPYYTDGRVAIRSSTGGQPLSTPSTDWVANGTATTITRCTQS